MQLILNKDILESYTTVSQVISLRIKLQVAVVISKMKEVHCEIRH